MLAKLAGRLVTSPTAFLLAAVLDIAAHALHAVRTTRAGRRRQGRSTIPRR